jgi:hypothetical protein
MACRTPEHRPTWRVIARKGNASAFNGYHWTPSAYSDIRCMTPGCPSRWRSKAAYVDTIPDYDEAVDQWTT